MANPRPPLSPSPRPPAGARDRRRIHPLRRWGAAACLGIALAVSASAGVQGQGPAPADVPQGHWAHQAVVDVIERGMMGTFEDATFRGEQPVNRYDLALILSQLLREVESRSQPLSVADIEALRQLADGVREDLVAYYQSRDQLLEDIRTTHQWVAVFDEKLTEVLDQFEQVHREARIRELRWETQLSRLNAQMEALAQENQRLRERLAQLEGAAAPEGTGEGAGPEGAGGP